MASFIRCYFISKAHLYFARAINGLICGKLLFHFIVNVPMKRLLISIILAAVIVGLMATYWLTPAPIKPLEADYASLPGWNSAEVTQSFLAFKRSCDVFSKQPLDKNVGSKAFPLKISDWHGACLAANRLQSKDNQPLKAFFERWFHPVYFSQGKPMDGTFTGYYLPVLQGSWTKTSKYQYPIYELPPDLLSIDLSQFNDSYGHKKIIGRVQGKRIVPYYNRESINQGVLSKKMRPLLWVSSRLDRFFLEIQGSGYVDFDDGARIMLGYAGQNGRSYTSIGRYLVEKGAFDKAKASMQAIRSFLTNHPEQMNKTLNQNQSFIFFKQLKKGLAVGAQGSFLTAGYSLAVDRQHIPLGVPMWLTTYYPQSYKVSKHPFNRLMIAQDTGGAIKGRVRGDVFWGGEKNAAYVAGHMNSKGQYWILLPKIK